MTRKSFREIRPWCGGLLVSLALCLLPGGVRAQTRAGGEFQVNTGTTARQDGPSVACDPNGNFVVFWQSTDLNRGVFGQRYDATGTRQGGEFRVNTGTTFQFEPSVAYDAAGNFVVVWWESGSGVFGQRYDATGTPRGGTFQVNTFTIIRGPQPSVASDAAGNFVVAWQLQSNPDDNFGAVDVSSRRYDATGTPQGGEFQVNTYTPYAQGEPSVASDAAGNFVVVWTSAGNYFHPDGQDGSGSGVFGQRYNASGTPQGGEFRINTYTTNSQFNPSVASDAAGNFVVVWHSFQQNGPFGVFAQRYNASGTPQGVEFQVNTFTLSNDSVPRVASDAAGNFVVVWESYGQDGSRWGVFGRRYDATGTPQGGEFRINTFTPGRQRDASVASDAAGNFVVTWSSEGQDGSDYGVFAQRFGGLLPSALSVDPTATTAPAVSDGNGVLEAGETVLVAPSWRNVNGAGQTFTGTASSFTGPGSAGDYTLADLAADYGAVANGTTGSCAATGNCYSLGISVPSSRPVKHWDATVREDILPVTQGQSKTWTLHVGESFPDVPRLHPFYRFVETIFHHGVTSGCNATDYCPSSSVTRAQMAKLLLRAKLGAGYTPPSCTRTFADVACPSLFADWIEDLYGRGITQGCNANPLMYCPADAVSRGQMAVLLLKTLLGPSYTPPSCTGLFTDVACPSVFADWIEDLYGRGITQGCGTNPLRYCPGSAVSRGQMAAFLARTFGLTLYGP